MFRLSTIAVLALLMALPRGVCFCDWLHASASTHDVACEIAPPISPTDESDDHERDCPCKLRDVATVSPAPIAPIDGGAEFAHEVATDRDTTFRFDAFSNIRPSTFMPFDGSLPLTLRALRI
jgi:hypothetical protein